MKIKKILTIALLFAPLAGFAFSCPNVSVFQKANLVKQDSKQVQWYTFQSEPQAANGWTIGFISLSVNNIVQANSVLKTAHPQYVFDNGTYCTYKDKSIADGAFWATKENGPSADFHPSL